MFNIFIENHDLDEFDEKEEINLNTLRKKWLYKEYNEQPGSLLHSLVDIVDDVVRNLDSLNCVKTDREKLFMNSFILQFNDAYMLLLNNDFDITHLSIFKKLKFDFLLFCDVRTRNIIVNNYVDQFNI
jgi:hypothetical protein